MASFLSKVLQHCTSRHCNEQNWSLPPRPISPLQYKQLYHSHSPKSAWVFVPTHNNHLFHPAALYLWLTTFRWCVFLFQIVLYHQGSQSSNRFTHISKNINKWVMQISKIDPNQQVHQSILRWTRWSHWARWGHLTLLALQFSTS